MGPADVLGDSRAAIRRQRRNSRKRVLIASAVPNNPKVKWRQARFSLPISRNFPQEGCCTLNGVRFGHVRQKLVKEPEIFSESCCIEATCFKLLSGRFHQLDSRAKIKNMSARVEGGNPSILDRKSTRLNS